MDNEGIKIDEDKYYSFNPQSSITPYELAQVICFVMRISVAEYAFDEVPKEIRKHFTEGRHENRKD